MKNSSIAMALMPSLTVAAFAVTDEENARLQKLESAVQQLQQENTELKREVTELRQHPSALPKDEREMRVDAIQAPKRTPSIKLNSGIEKLELFGDLRVRYEHREGQTNLGDTFARDRERYAVRVGVRGEMANDIYFGLRLETSSNPRSTWVTFGGEHTFPFPGPSSKSDDGVFIGQAYVGWRPTKWADFTVGRMPNPLYTTPMVWDPDISPEGVSEKFKFKLGHVELFANFGQFLYQDVDPNNPAPPVVGTLGNHTDAFLLTWQLGANFQIAEQITARVAPILYNYTGHGSGAGFNGTFVGQGSATGANFFDPEKPGFINQTGINDLFVFEIPAEINFKVGALDAKVFGDFAYNLDGNSRAARAAQAGGFLEQRGEDKAYQVGFALGNNLGLVTGSTSKQGTWETRLYWQHLEQYAEDVNLIDSDFFEGRANLEGLYSAVAYSFTDNLIATLRYGYAHRINSALGTGGSNQDLPQLNPVNGYQLFQADITLRF